MRCDSQSFNFYADLSRYISKTILGHETLSLLDVGPRTGAGLALLRLLHHPRAFTRLKFEPVVGIDLDPEFQRIAETEFRDIRAMTGDVFNLPLKSYDIVTCSHTIEHIPDPRPFVERLMAIGRRALFIACPFEEQNRVPGHCVTIDRAFFDDLGFDDVEVYESQHWHNGLACLAYKRLEG
jgi:SAM-dependent methyltransferase